MVSIFGSLKCFYKWWIVKNVTIFQAWVNSSNIHSIHSSFYLIHLSKSCQRANFGGKKNRGWLQHEFNYIFVTIANWNGRDFPRSKWGLLAPKSWAAHAELTLLPFAKTCFTAVLLLMRTFASSFFFLAFRKESQWQQQTAKQNWQVLYSLC